jgi:hypothetical protein
MSLDWSLEDVENYDRVCFVRVESGDFGYEDVTVSRHSSWSIREDGQKYIRNPITNKFISLTMQIGLGDITSDNIEEWQYRLWWLEKVLGEESFYVQRWIPRAGMFDSASKINEDDLRSHIGLSTNADQLDRDDWFVEFVSKVDRELNNFKWKYRWTTTHKGQFNEKNT